MRTLLAELNAFGPWSPSRIQVLQQCPQRHYWNYILKKKEPKTAMMQFGTAAHMIAYELCTKGLETFDQAFTAACMQNFLTKEQATKLFEARKHFITYLDFLSLLGNPKKYEYKFAFRKDLSPCNFFASDVFFRGIYDVVVFSDSPQIVDLKTAEYQENISQTYQQQLNFYIWILQKLCNVATVKAALFHLFEEKTVWYPAPKDLEEIIFETLRFARNNVEKQTPNTGIHCTYCGYVESCNARKGNK